MPECSIEVRSDKCRVLQQLIWQNRAMNRRLVKDILSGWPAAMTQAWAGSEIDLIVADYFAMLGSELAGEAINKAATNRGWRPERPKSGRTHTKYRTPGRLDVPLA